MRNGAETEKVGIGGRAEDSQVVNFLQFITGP